MQDEADDLVLNYLLEALSWTLNMNMCMIWNLFLTILYYNTGIDQGIDFTFFLGVGCAVIVFYNLVNVILLCHIQPIHTHHA